jgi:hypothetical protein
MHCTARSSFSSPFSVSGNGNGDAWGMLFDGKITVLMQIMMIIFEKPVD